MHTDIAITRPERQHGPHAGPTSGRDYAFGRFTLQPARKLLACAGVPVVLGGRAFDLLVALVACAGEVVGHHALLAAVWPHAVVEENGLRVHMSALRKALGETPDDQYIVTVPGHGYRFVKPVHAVAPGSASLPGALSGVASGAVQGLALAAPSWRPAVRLVGRAEAAAALETLLDGAALVTLAGPGGIGKTALALLHASTHRARYGDGCHLVDFAALSDPALVPAALCAALGIALDRRDPLAAIGAALGPLHALLVFDNCEHVLAQAGACAAAIVAAAPRTKVLVTSRVPLGAAGEAVYRLAPLALPAPDATPDCAAARAQPAIALFEERAQANASGFVLGPDNLDAVLQLCRQLDGLPLAIELAAARVEALGVGGLVARLDDMFRLLTRSRRLASPRHAALEAMLDCSYRLLDEAERTVLRRLAVFHGAFSLEAAVRVCAFDGLAPADVLRAVQALADQSLLCSEPGSGTARYRSLNTTRRYARLRLAASGEAHQAARRHAGHLRALFEQAPAEAAEGAAWQRRHDAVGADLLAALDWAFGDGGEARLGLALCAEAPLSMIELGMLDGFRCRIETALAIAAQDDSDPALEARLLAAWTLASTPVALAPDQRAAMQARLLRHAAQALAGAARAQLAGALCVGAFMAGDYARMVTASAAMELEAGTQGAGPDAQAARLLASRWSALGLHFQGRHREARARALQTLETVMPRVAAHLLGPVPQRVSMGMVLARSEWIEGAADVALVRARQVVVMAESEHPFALGLALGMALAPIALWRGDDTLALQALERLEAHARRHGLGFWSAWAAQLRPALGAAASSPPADAGSDPMAIEMLATIRPAVLDSAMLDGAGRGQETWCDPELLRVRAERAGAGAEVEAQLAQAIVLAQAQGALAWELRASTSLARRWGQSGRVHAALALLGGVLARFHQGFDTADLRAAAGLRTQLAEAQDRATGAPG